MGLATERRQFLNDVCTAFTDCEDNVGRVGVLLDMLGSEEEVHLEIAKGIQEERDYEMAMQMVFDQNDGGMQTQRELLHQADLAKHERGRQDPAQSQRQRAPKP